MHAISSFLAQGCNILTHKLSVVSARRFIVVWQFSIWLIVFAFGARDVYGKIAAAAFCIACIQIECFECKRGLLWGASTPARSRFTICERQVSASTHAAKKTSIMLQKVQQLFVLSASRSPGRDYSIHLADSMDKGDLQRWQVTKVTHANKNVNTLFDDGCWRLRTLELFSKTKNLGQTQKFGNRKHSRATLQVFHNHRLTHKVKSAQLTSESVWVSASKSHFLDFS